MSEPVVPSNMLQNIPTGMANDVPLPPISSYCPDYSLIPLSAMKSLAMRYELGEKKYGRNTWQANIVKHREKYIIERLNHVIDHAKKLQGKLEGTIPWDKDDDVGGILWGGAAAAEAMQVLGFAHHVDPMAEVNTHEQQA